MTGEPVPWALRGKDLVDEWPPKQALGFSSLQPSDVIGDILRLHDSWEAGLAACIAAGASDEEIWEGGWLAGWPIPARRHLEELVAAERRRSGTAEVETKPVRSQVRPEGVPEATPSNVVAERQRRIDAGELFGVDELAKVFVVSQTTIRRRLDRQK